MSTYVNGILTIIKVINTLSFFRNLIIVDYSIPRTLFKKQLEKDRPI